MATRSSTEETEEITDMEISQSSSENIGTNGQIASGSSALPSLALIPVLLLMMQHLKTESDFYKKENNRLNQENEALIEELEKSHKEIGRLRNCLHFPLLSLPDEIIGHILSFLPIKDRMIARICKKLDEIESEYRYYVPKLLICERATDDPHRFNNSYFMRHKQYFVLLKERIYSIDFFKRIISNAKFGYLAIDTFDTYEFQHELSNLIKYADVGKLVLRCWDSILVDSYLFDLMRTCSKLKLYYNASISSRGLHKVYTDIMNGSTKLRSINVGTTSGSFLIDFLRRIGIAFSNGDLHSNRNIEAYELEVIYEEEEEEPEVIILHIHIFDRQLEIIFYEDPNYDTARLKLKWHETKEDLARAKNRKGFVRIEVFPE